MNQPTPNVTTPGIIARCREITETAYRQQLEQFGLKGKKLEDMTSGLRDGMSAMVQHMVGLGLIEIVDEVWKGSAGVPAEQPADEPTDANDQSEIHNPERDQ